jgi:carboxyl-terminal processing protease
VVVIDPQPDSPAARAGLAPGDLLLAIDGQSVSGLPFAEVLKLLRLPPGRSIAIELQHGGAARAVTLAPQTLKAVQPVEAIPQGDTLTLKLTRFSEAGAAAVQALLTELKPARVIVDLRGNPGGGLEPALSIAAALSGPGAVAQVTLRDGEEALEAAGARLFEGPLEVWVDGGTASAAELLALALEGRGAVLKGSKTFGRCLAFALEELPDGRSLFFTFGRMHARGAKPWCATGLTPSAPVP